VKRITLAIVGAALIAVIAVSSLIAINYASNWGIQDPEDRTLYVGVTYCGNSVSDAKLLIDKVKNYTNLFVLQSGSLQSNSSIDAIGDYAVNSGMNFIVYLGINSIALANNWLSSYDGRWGSHFLGVYAMDEPGGKMLEGNTFLFDPTDNSFITKTRDGITCSIINGSATFMRNGTVSAQVWDSNETRFLTYYPNGTITTRPDPYDPEVVLNDISDLTYSYDQLWEQCPIQNSDDAEKLFVNSSNSTIASVHNRCNSTFKVFTSDYALDWFDYQSGYDAVFAEFCWNESTTRDIALARGAADAFGKDWGAMITWQYDKAPYLPYADEMYQRMCAAYENGAKYIIVFNYADDMQRPYGLLDQPRFDALERFFKDELNSAFVMHDAVKADTAFVLPPNYGSGLRSQDDVVWGMWTANQTDRQIWQRMQNALSTYGEKLNIVYDDPAHPVSDRYSQVIYWNQTE
jgi:hypothetical protein